MEMLMWHFPHLVSLLCFQAVFLYEVGVMKFSERSLKITAIKW